MQLVSLIYLPFFNFLLRYRRTVIGPLWLLVGPSLFIFILGMLYSEIGAAHHNIFIPHLTIGLISWTLISGFIIRSATIFQRNKAQILQGAQSLDEIIIGDVVTSIITFIHQLPIVLVVIIIFEVEFNLTALKTLFGILLLIANGIWVGYAFGILGARFRDISEILNAVMRIAFLATPIIWIPGASFKSDIINNFLIYNPFYHFIELIRAPLLSKEPELLNWIIVLFITIIGFFIAYLLKKKYAHNIPFWL